MQKNRIIEFLNSIREPWKVLILDSRTQDIISPLIKLNELRDCGVSSYFLITQKRNKISSTPAVYFVQEIDKIAEDVYEDLYSSYYINCVTSIKIRELEKLGYELSSKGQALRIGSVYDQFLDFVSLQEDFFSLELRDSYIRKGDVDLIRKIVVSLLSVFVTLNGIPFIYCNEESTKSIGRLLNEKIKGTNIIKRGEKRPLLVLVDRDYDIISPVQHVWSYSALINDLLEIKNNKVEVKDKKYDLDPTDSLWKENRNEYFPLVVERVDKEFVEYKKEMALRSIDSRSDKKTIQRALEKAPELAKKNESVNAHISMCLEMVEIVKKRNIDDFYKIEKSGYSHEELLNISEKGNEIDILRLALCLLNTKDGDLAEAMLKKRGVESYAVEYFKKFRKSCKMEETSTFSSVVSGIVGNVKKLLPVKEKSPLSELVEEVYNKIKSQVYSRSDFIDPIGINTLHPKEISSIVVFTVGGCTYSELKTLKVLEEKIKIPILYGGSEVLNAIEFIRQVEEIKNGK